MTRTRRAAVVAPAVVLLVLPAAYLRVGWSRMEQACGADPPGAPAWRSVSYDWSWSPPGFRCTYDTGVRRTSVWFGA